MDCAGGPPDGDQLCEEEHEEGRPQERRAEQRLQDVAGQGHQVLPHQAQGQGALQTHLPHHQIF